MDCIAQFSSIAGTGFCVSSDQRSVLMIDLSNGKAKPIAVDKTHNMLYPELIDATKDQFVLQVHDTYYNAVMAFSHDGTTQWTYKFQDNQDKSEPICILTKGHVLCKLKDSWGTVLDASNGKAVLDHWKPEYDKWAFGPLADGFVLKDANSRGRTADYRLAELKN